MKQASNNEVDLLLRSLAKGRDGSALHSGSASAGGNGAFPDHLDADELNSYAEGVVPAAARARYTEHLADCDACRRLVVDLSQAAGVANRFEVPQQQRNPGFWQKLAAIFSPAVLPYAVPALILTAVIGIGLLALRQQRPEFVALNQETPKTRASSGEQPKQLEAQGGDSGSAPPAAVATESGSPSVNDSIVSKTDRAEKSADTPAPDLSSGLFDSSTVAKDGPPPAKAGEGAQYRPYAPEPKAGAPAPPPAAVQSESDEMTRLAKEAPAKRENQVQERGRDDFKNQQPVEEHGPNRSAAPQRGPYNNSQRNVGGVTLGSGPNTENKKADAEDKKARAKAGDKAKPSDVETRHVSGRRFAREDNAWIDTAYESSRATINVKRGSEQFRSLVADEPGLGAIADQLKGVVIVVWKSRAYRIQ